MPNEKTTFDFTPSQMQTRIADLCADIDRLKRPVVVDALPESPGRDVMYWLTKDGGAPLENPVAGESYPVSAKGVPSALDNAIPFDISNWRGTEINGAHCAFSCDSAENIAAAVNAMYGQQILSVSSGGEARMLFASADWGSCVYIYEGEEVGLNGTNARDWAFMDAETASLTQLSAPPELLRGTIEFAQADIDSGFASALFELVKPAGLYRHNGTDWELLLEKGSDAGAELEAKLEALAERVTDLEAGSSGIQNVLAAPPADPQFGFAYNFTKEWGAPLVDPVAGEVYYARPKAVPGIPLIKAPPQNVWESKINGITTQLACPTAEELTSIVNDNIGANWSLDSGGEVYVTFVQRADGMTSAAVYFHGSAVIDGVEHSGWRMFTHGVSSAALEPIGDYLSNYKGNWAFASNDIDGGVASAFFELIKPAGWHYYAAASESDKLIAGQAYQAKPKAAPEAVPTEMFVAGSTSNFQSIQLGCITVNELAQLIQQETGGPAYVVRSGGDTYVSVYGGGRDVEGYSFYFHNEAVIEINEDVFYSGWANSNTNFEPPIPADGPLGAYTDTYTFNQEAIDSGIVNALLDVDAGAGEPQWLPLPGGDADLAARVTALEEMLAAAGSGLGLAEPTEETGEEAED